MRWTLDTVNPKGLVNNFKSRERGQYEIIILCPMFHRSRIVNPSFTGTDHWSQWSKCAESKPTFSTKISPPSSHLFVQGKGSMGHHKCACVHKCMSAFLCLCLWVCLCLCVYVLTSLIVLFMFLVPFWLTFWLFNCYFWTVISSFIWSWNDEEGCWVWPVWPRVLSHHFAVSSKITSPPPTPPLVNLGQKLHPLQI